MDEATLSGDNIIYEVNDHGEISHYTLNAQDIGLSYASNDQLIGGTPQENLIITKNIPVSYTHLTLPTICSV